MVGGAVFKRSKSRPRLPTGSLSSQGKSSEGESSGKEGILSVKRAFSGSSVLLTGVTGYVGSIVLEQLLRVCTDVKTVYVLIRGKRNLTSKQRLEKLLSSGLFHHFWKAQDVLKKIRVVEGDITQEDLGLDAKDKEDVINNVQFVIHSAAAVALNDPMKKTLSNNYMSTYRLLELCNKIPNLLSYTHVSTAYANINFERGSTVKEKVYPLVKGDRLVTHADIVTELMQLKDDESEFKATVLMDRFNYPNTYSFGKRLTEELVVDYYKKGIPCCIVRPSLITGVEGDPYPGYTGNLAGGAGFAIAYAVGFFEKNSAAWEGSGVCDIVPGDIVSSVVLAAAASNTLKGVQEEEIPVFHACTSCSYPISNSEMYTSAYEFFTKESAPYCLLCGPYPQFSVTYKPNPYLVYLAKSTTAIKVYFICWIMRLLGRNKVANRLHVGWRAWDFGNQARYDMNLYFSVENVIKLDNMLVDEERNDLRLLFTPANANWARYMRTYLSAIKTILLKSTVGDNSDHDFRLIPDCDPPIKLSDAVARKITQTSESEVPVARKVSNSISPKLLPGLGRTLSFISSAADPNDMEDSGDDPESSELDSDNDDNFHVAYPSGELIGKGISSTVELSTKKDI